MTAASSARNRLLTLRLQSRATEDVDQDSGRGSYIERLQAAAAGNRHQFIASGEDSWVETGFLIAEDQSCRPIDAPIGRHCPPSESRADNTISPSQLTQCIREQRAV